MNSKLLLVIPFICLNSANVFASDFVPKEAMKLEWSFDKLFGKFDHQSIQRGFKVYKEVCSACHSLKRIAFRNLTEIGFSNEEVKAIAHFYQINDGPNDEGEYFDRPGIQSDYLPSPYANKQEAMAANNGAVPPDLSLIVKARHNGANYIYSLLNGYVTDNETSDGLHTNSYFSAGKLAMAPPLMEGIIEYDDGTEPSLHNLSRDVVNFLQWAAEPETEERKRLAVKVISFLTILTFMLYKLYKKIWSDLHK